MCKPVIFISYSGPQSEECAILVQEFLQEFYRLDEGQVFMSLRDMHTHKDTFFDEVINSSISSDICISCITKSNQLAPWITFEAGLFMVCHGNNNSRIPLLKKEIPVIMDFYYSELDEELSMFKQKRVVHSKCKLGSKEYYNDILRQIVVEVDTFVAKNINNDVYVIRPYGIERCEDAKLKSSSMLGRCITSYSKKMCECFKKYESHDTYISRPIKGVPDDVREKLDEVIKCVTTQANRDNISIFSSLGNEQTGGLLQSRFEILKKSKHFLLIYPTITDASLPPSSCFMELGAAIAFENCKVSILYHEDARLPEFLNNINRAATDIFLGTYHDDEDLKEKIFNRIKNY